MPEKNAAPASRPPVNARLRNSDGVTSGSPPWPATRLV